MTDPVIFSPDGDNDELDRLRAYDDFALTENRAVDLAPGLVSLGFIAAALRRSAWFWSATAILGLIIGLGIYVHRPHGDKATASLLLTTSPYEDGLTALEDNQAIAETSAVAAIAVRELGLHQSASSFASTYSAASVTDKILAITVSAPSASQAQLRATAVGNAFLQFRKQGQLAQEKLVLESIDQQLTLADQRVSSIDAQISQLSSQRRSAAQQSQLNALNVDLTNAKAALTSVQQALGSNQSSTVPNLTAALKGSYILSVTPVPYSKKKELAIYGGLGLVLGLVLGLAIVIVRGLISDRLRRRDDIAYVLDAPVKLSVSSLLACRRLPTWPGRARRQVVDLRRVVAHLRDAVARSSRGPAGLVIVAVDNAPVVAQAVAGLAVFYASQGNQVVTADLSAGAQLARLLGTKRPGVHRVSRNGTNFAVAVPDRDDPGPVGPLPAGAWYTAAEQADDALVAPNTSADLLLTLATLDPGLGGAHLTTWASDAVVVVTAGRSSAERIHAVGEMVRLAEMRLDSVVLLGADKGDESLGLMRKPEEGVGSGSLRT